MADKTRKYLLVSFTNVLNVLCAIFVIMHDVEIALHSFQIAHAQFVNVSPKPRPTSRRY